MDNHSTLTRCCKDLRSIGTQSSKLTEYAVIYAAEQTNIMRLYVKEMWSPCNRGLDILKIPHECTDDTLCTSAMLNAKLPVLA